MHFSDSAGGQVIDAELGVSAIGWCVDADALGLSAVGIGD